MPPLAQSVLSRDQGQVSNLLRAGENPDDRVRGKDGARAGFTPLILVAAISDAEIAQMLIRAGAKITASDDFHRSAFWYAALRGDVQLTKVLVEVPGAKEAVNLTDDDLKRAPLHMAVHGNKPELVQILLRTGASTALKDYLEETPIEFCKRRFTKGCAGLER